MAKGRTEEALSLYEKNVKSPNDQLLRLMDEGILLRVAERFEESNQKFLEAARLIEHSGYISLGEQGLTLLTNEKQKYYQGEDFEKVLIHVFLALNFIQLENWESALVSARKVNEILYVMISEGKRDYELNPFAKYLGGLLFEREGEINDAFISYKQTYEMDPELAKLYPTLQVDLLRTALWMEFDSEVEKYTKLFGEEALQKAKEAIAQRKASLVLLFESGKSPRKYSSRERHTSTGKGGSLVEVVLPVPYYKERHTNIFYAELRAGKNRARTKTLEDIESTAIRHLQDRMGRYIAKALLQAGVKAGIAAGIGKATNSDELGLLAGLALFLASEADTRSWLLLPEKLQVARLYLEPGEYQVSIDYVNQYGQVQESEDLGRFQLKPKEVRFIERRSFE